MARLVLSDDAGRGPPLLRSVNRNGSLAPGVMQREHA